MYIRDYNLYRNDRTWTENGHTKKGGGVCIYTRKELDVDCQKWNDHNISNEDVECMWLELRFSNQRNIIANIYRPPQGNKQNFITYLEEKIDTINMGDYNIDFLDKKDDITKRINNRIKQWGSKKLITDVTRHGTHKDSCIDQIITNSNIINTYGVADMNLSDHQMINVQRKKPKMPTKKNAFQGRSYKNYDGNVFRQELVEQDWDGFFAREDPKELWNIMLENINNIADNMCPVKSFKVKKYRDPWISPEILEIIRDKDRALKRAKRTKLDEDWKEAKRLRNNCLGRIRKARGDLIREELDTYKSDSKKFWKKNHELIPKNNKNTNKIELVNQENKKTILEEDAATFINEFFSNIGPNLAKKFNQEWKYKGVVSETQLENIFTNEAEIVKICKDIDVSKAACVNNLSSILHMFQLAQMPNFKLWKVHQPIGTRTRSSKKRLLTSRKPTNEKFRRSITYQGPKLWNSLPANIQKLGSYCEFKKEVMRLFQPLIAGKGKVIKQKAKKQNAKPNPRPKPKPKPRPKPKPKPKLKLNLTFKTKTKTKPPPKPLTRTQNLNPNPNPRPKPKPKPKSKHKT